MAKPQLGLELLLTQDPERAKSLAKILNQCNEDRQGLQEKQLDQAKRLVENSVAGPGIVVDSPHWHPGVGGVIAAKLAETYHRPAIALVHEGENAKGSARSIPGLHIVEVLERCKDLLLQFGGHQGAAGLTVALKNLEAFKNRFAEVLLQQLGNSPVLPSVTVDAELQLGDIQPNLVDELEKLRPFGIGNPEPLFAIRQIELKDPLIVGKNHLKIKISDQMQLLEGIAFGLGTVVTQSTRADIVCLPEWNTFRDTTKIQLKIKDVQVTKN